MKSKNIYTLIIFLSICSASFAQPVSTEGFSKTSGGLYYKLIVDNKKTKGRLGDVIKMNLIYMTQRDSVLFSTYEEEMGPVQFTINSPTFHGDPMGGVCIAWRRRQRSFSYACGFGISKPGNACFCKKTANT